MAFGFIPFISFAAVLVVMIVTETNGVIVTYGTKGGPIEPPEPTKKIIPIPPYRSPAPAWEDQSDDIPNPKPFIYQLPPPSRTDSPLNDIFRPETSTARYSSPASTYSKMYYTNDAYRQVTASPRHTSFIASKPIQQFGVKYIPNYGLKYYPYVPMNYYNIKHNEISSNSIYDDGKYNSKYEKKYAKYAQAKLAQANILPLLSKKHLHYLNQLQQQPYYSSNIVHQG